MRWLGIVAVLIFAVQTAVAEEHGLEVLVQAPDWALKKTINVTVRDIIRHKEFLRQGVPAGTPVTFKLPRGTYVARVTGEGIATCFAGPVAVEASPRAARAVIAIERGITLRGRVSVEPGTPLPGARITLGEIRYGLPFRHETIHSSLLAVGWRDAVSTVTDEDGRYLLKDFASSTLGHRSDHKIVVEKPGYHSLVESVALEPGVTIEKEFRLQKGTASITGWIRTGAGNGVAGAWLYWIDPRVKIQYAGGPTEPGKICLCGPSCEDGAFEIVDPPPGETRFQVVVPGMKVACFTGSPGGEHEIAVERARDERTVRVVAAEGGSLLEDGVVRFGRLGFFPFSLDAIRTGPGEYTLRGELGRHPFYLRVNAPGRVPRYVKSELLDEVPSAPFVVELEKGLTFTLAIVGAAGTPIDGIRVWTSKTMMRTPHDSEDLEVVQTMPGRARVTMRGLKPCRMTVYAEAPHYHRSQAEFDVSKGGQEATLTMKPLF